MEFQKLFVRRTGHRTLSLRFIKQVSKALEMKFLHFKMLAFGQEGIGEAKRKFFMGWVGEINSLKYASYT